MTIKEKIKEIVNSKKKDRWIGIYNEVDYENGFYLSDVRIYGIDEFVKPEIQNKKVLKIVENIIKNEKCISLFYQRPMAEF